MITVYFENEDPIKEKYVSIPRQRTKDIVTSNLSFNEKTIPKGISYAVNIDSEVTIVVQHSRMDASQAENTLMTTMEYLRNA